MDLSSKPSHPGGASEGETRESGSDLGGSDLQGDSLVATSDGGSDRDLRDGQRGGSPTVPRRMADCMAPRYDDDGGEVVSGEMHGLLKASTRRAYAGLLRKWAIFCEQENIGDATRGMELFLKNCVDSRTYVDVSHLIAAFRAARKLLELEDEDLSDRAWDFAEIIRRRRLVWGGKERVPCDPIEPGDVWRIRGPLLIRDAALMVCTLRMGLRPNEAAKMDVEDCALIRGAARGRDVWKITIKRHKVRDGSKTYHELIEGPPGGAFEILEEHVDFVAGTWGSGPLFRKVAPPHDRLSPDGIGGILRKLGERLPVPRKWSGKSGRAGMVCELARSGMPSEVACRVADWRSQEMVRTYLRDAGTLANDISQRLDAGKF